MLKKFFVFLLLSVTTVGAIAWVSRYDLVADHFLATQDTRPVENSVCSEANREMKTSDGMVLRADVYRPCNLATAPTILVRFPYTRGDPLKIGTYQNELGVGAIAHFFSSRGYNTVVQGTRGRYKSEGVFYPMIHERQDGLDTLAWLKRQPWFDGRLAMWGGSAFGHTQWAISDQTTPKISALNIHIASTSFREAFHPGGAFALESALYWALRSHSQVDVIPSVEAIDKGVAGWPLIKADDRAESDIGFFNDWLKHRRPDGYWQKIDGHQRAKSTKAPVLLMAGWSDPFLPTMIRDFQDLRSQDARKKSKESRIIIGPWVHAGSVTLPDGRLAAPYRTASIGWSLPWFDHHLLGRPLPKELSPPILIYVRGDDVWRNEYEWPLARARNTPFYFDKPVRSDIDGQKRLAMYSLVSSMPDKTNTPHRFVYDPHKPVPTRGGAMLGLRAGIKQQNDIVDRPDVVSFASPPLDQDMEVTGPVKAILYVATDAPNTDFTVKLLDQHPDGRIFNVTSGILRRDYTNSIPVQPTEITIELLPTSMVFKKGHRIQVVVSSSDFPKFDRNPNTGTDPAYETKPKPARQSVFLGNSTPSRIILPLVAR